jgi:iron complex transport system substrate-binding protein
MTRVHLPPMSRRAALVMAGGAAITALAGCAAQTPAASTSTSAGPWTFTDDLKHTVTLEKRPTRIAGYRDLLGPLMVYGIEPVASFGWTATKNDVRFDDLDTSGVTEVGADYGEINLEKLAELQPDLIVVNAYPVDATGVVDQKQPLYGFKDLAQQKKVAAIAPIVAITMGGSGLTVIDRTSELALSLGAKQSVITAAKTRFDAARKTLTTAATGSGVTVEAIYADADGIYVNKPVDDPTLRMFKELGVDMVQPAKDDGKYYWRILSYENASLVTGDLLLYSPLGYSPAELKKRPTTAKIPAVAAGHIQSWPSTFTDYESQAQYMQQLAGWITALA